MDEFYCDKCGACCRHLKLFGEPYAWLLDDESGQCRYFDSDNNLCSIYPIRPIMCNLEQGWQVYFAHMSWDEFKARNAEACVWLKGLGE